MSDTLSLPPMFAVQRRFEARRIPDVTASVLGTLDACPARPRPGARVAVAVGSRGISGLATLVRTTVDWLKAHGASPFVLPAMGSHGGATGPGQAEVLAGYGVTAAAMGVPVVSSLDVRELPRGDAPVPVFMSADALAADATVLIGRIKPHTDFHGPYESGLMKMLAIGLGKHAQALALHRHGTRGLREYMPLVARQMLAHGNVLLGLGVVENAYDQPAHIEAVAAADIPAREPALLDMARANLPRLPLDEIDVLVVDRLGKDISGAGMDTNVINRHRIQGEPEPAGPPRIRAIVVRALTPASHGNAAGLGLADVVTRRVMDAVDLRVTYENIVTSAFFQRGFTPLVAEDDREALRWALRGAGEPPPERLRLLRIRDTLHLADLHASAAAVEAMQGRADVTVGAPVGLLGEGGMLVEGP